MAKKVKILYIIDKMKPAGAQNHLRLVMDGLDKSRFEPHLMTLEELGVRRIYDLGGIRGFFRLARYMKRGKFDIVQTYLFSENILGVMAARFAGVKTIVTGRRDTGMLCQGAWPHILAYRLTNPFVSKIVCVSEAVRRVVLEKERVAPEKVEVIYNGVDIERLQGQRVSAQVRECSSAQVQACKSEKGPKRLRDELGIDANDLVVGMIANFSWIKGHEVLLEAAPEIVRQVPNAGFALAGEGPLLDGCRLQAAGCALKDKFIFLGKRNDIPELLGIFDISLNLSYSEGMSNTILESMAAGVPVVATAVDGNLETVRDNETGILVPPKDAKALAGAVIRLLKDEGLREKMGENARRLARERFDVKTMVGRMEKLYVEEQKG